MKSRPPPNFVIFNWNLVTVFHSTVTLFLNTYTCSCNIYWLLLKWLWMPRSQYVCMYTAAVPSIGSCNARLLAVSTFVWIKSLWASEIVRNRHQPISQDVISQHGQDLVPHRCSLYINEIRMSKHINFVFPFSDVDMCVCIVNIP